MLASSFSTGNLHSIEGKCLRGNKELIGPILSVYGGRKRQELAGERNTVSNVSTSFPLDPSPNRANQGLNQIPCDK
ncbi:hypothetical protein JCGZ_03240 [Jatropha curcas]|uniref:Uncharacterized protein n=1 Tax=Jatropha curcas TaxID=180498 RepID=A0A067L9D1_JATCU|nr:hypothetical protein JCGZ_03240 [Jatropha curcas]